MTHEKTLKSVSITFCIVVLILETLNMTPGQLFKLLHSGVPLSVYSDKLVIIVWFIVSSYLLHFVGIAKAASIQANLLRRWWFVGIT